MHDEPDDVIGVDRSSRGERRLRFDGIRWLAAALASVLLAGIGAAVASGGATGPAAPAALGAAISQTLATSFHFSATTVQTSPDSSAFTATITGDLDPVHRSAHVLTTANGRPDEVRGVAGTVYFPLFVVDPAVRSLLPQSARWVAQPFPMTPFIPADGANALVPLLHLYGARVARHGDVYSVAEPGPQPAQFRVTVGADGRVHHLVEVAHLNRVGPFAGAGPTLRVTLDLDRFGEPVQVVAPPAAQVVSSAQYGAAVTRGEGIPPPSCTHQGILTECTSSLSGSVP